MTDAQRQAARATVVAVAKQLSELDLPNVLSDAIDERANREYGGFPLDVARLRHLCQLIEAAMPLWAEMRARMGPS